MSVGFAGGQYLLGFLAKELFPNPVDKLSSTTGRVVLFDRSVRYDAEEEVGEVVPETSIEDKPL